MCWCLLLVGNGGEEEKRRGRGRERDLLGCACACACALPPSQHTHTHCIHTHTHTHTHTQALISPLLPSLSPLAGLACCHPPPPLFLFLSSLPQQAQTHTQMHGLGCTLLPPQHPTHPQGRREGKEEEYSTQPNSHAAQVHHTPLHAINNENRAGKTKKKKKRTGVGNEEMHLVIHMLFLFIFCSFLIHINFFHPHTLFTFLPRFYPFLYSFHLSFLYPMPQPLPTPLAHKARCNCKKI